jgi:hypothetical protein
MFTALCAAVLAGAAKVCPVCCLTLELRVTAAVGRQAPKTENVHRTWLRGLVARRCCSHLSDWLGGTGAYALSEVHQLVLARSVSGATC